jgi:hypothetical protein
MGGGTLMRQRMAARNSEKYYDKMKCALNKNIEKNIFPKWRDHSSLKGKRFKL